MKNITALVCMVFIIVTMVSCSDMEPAGMTEPPSISGSAADTISPDTSAQAIEEIGYTPTNIKIMITSTDSLTDKYIYINKEEAGSLPPKQQVC